MAFWYDGPFADQQIADRPKFQRGHDGGTMRLVPSPASEKLLTNLKRAPLAIMFEEGVGVRLEHHKGFMGASTFNRNFRPGEDELPGLKLNSGYATLLALAVCQWYGVEVLPPLTTLELDELGLEGEERAAMTSWRNRAAIAMRDLPHHNPATVKATLMFKIKHQDTSI